MVRLSKIYTKTGDAGQTMLGDGSMTPKESLRVEAYGEIDEANAALGIAVAHICSLHGEAPSRMVELLTTIQHDLFDCGADLCVPVSADETQSETKTSGSRLRVVQSQIDRLEQAIDSYNEGLQVLTSFVLPGGTQAAADLHLARTVTRRAERAVAALIHAQPGATNSLVMVYLNRLSDLLFVLARIANTPPFGGKGDVLWVPGSSRDH
ncbi:MAG: cob(I)yrinic acid a,c-diamide adenosyltransferase [Phycisphaerales bacterium JB050]